MKSWSFLPRRRTTRQANPRHGSDRGHRSAIEPLEGRCLMSIAGGIDAVDGVANPPPLVRYVARSVVTGGTSFAFYVQYFTPLGMDAASVGADDIVVTGPNGFSAAAEPTLVRQSDDGDRLLVRYQVNAPGGNFDRSDNGMYTVTVQPGSVTDADGEGAVTGGPIGRFRVLSRHRAIQPPPTPGPAPSLPLSDTATAGALTVKLNGVFAWCDHMPGVWPEPDNREHLILGMTLTNTSDAPLEVRLDGAWISFNENELGTPTNGISLRGRDGRPSGVKTLILAPGETRTVQFRGDGVYPEDRHEQRLYATLQFSAAGGTAAVRNSAVVMVTH